MSDCRFKPGDVVRLKWTRTIMQACGATATASTMLVRELAYGNIPLVITRHIGPSRPEYVGWWSGRQTGRRSCYEALVNGELTVVADEDLTTRGPFNIKQGAQS